MVSKVSRQAKNTGTSKGGTPADFRSRTPSRAGYPCSLDGEWRSRWKTNPVASLELVPENSINL